ncbi:MULTISPECIES: type II CAAX endopeptidase family protein [unclassified Mammaliicoccus]|uniref:CPBP family intramembrane glutamic endopeptidase n=1 Tax=unclassified Mammaliicoccus TaxID=2803851 RepID=UPI001EFB35C6|nr:MULTISPECIES: type II CAAX endopeptidase family protein [unclassified Mammaliicoccus]HDF4598069.1 CPBP family intramembrane metalloprotease [Staphylococcus aureus]HDF4598708.1 CPBP family intramembrane metalloprotease [Staphylococcus aureus]HDF5118340.1 CPBP family intramembrane metalloprotease [Staphylococcus aureus]HDF5119070.1 CPBP family intramembrane metalloprotease [Staphylococcus aureus]
MKNLFVILKMIGLSLILFIISVFAQNLGILWHIFRLYTLEYVLHGLTYLIVSIGLVKLLVNKILKNKLSYYRVTTFKIYPLCLILGLLLPIIVITVYFMFISGDIIVTQFASKKDYIEMVISVLFISGIVAPIVEEIIFRGVLLKYIEDKTNIFVAIISTSVLFSLVHLFNGKLVGLDIYLLIIAGTIAGIMYGIACYKYSSIWASILLHMFWNIGGIFVITDTKEDYGILQYIINSSNVFITGGDYGMDASIISIVGYSLVIVVLLFSKKRNLKSL